MATLHNKCLDKMEKVLNMYNILRERDHIHITFITVYCYNYSTLLLVTVNLLLCLIYKLNFITGMYILEKNIVHIEFGTIHGFGHPLGGLRTYPLQIRGDYYKTILRDFPGGAVVKTLSSQCRGIGFDPWLGY